MILTHLNSSQEMRRLNLLVTKRPSKGITLGSGGRFLTTDRMRIDAALKASCGRLDYLDWIRVGMALKSVE